MVMPSSTPLPGYADPLSFLCCSWKMSELVPEVIRRNLADAKGLFNESMLPCLFFSSLPSFLPSSLPPSLPAFSLHAWFFFGRQNSENKPSHGALTGPASFSLFQCVHTLDQTESDQRFSENKGANSHLSFHRVGSNFYKQDCCQKAQSDSNDDREARTRLQTKEPSSNQAPRTLRKHQVYARNRSKQQHILQTLCCGFSAQLKALSTTYIF